MDYRSEVNFSIDGLTYLCPVFQDDESLILYLQPEVYDALVEDYDIIYARENVLYKDRLYNSYIRIEKDIIPYYSDSVASSSAIEKVIITNHYDYPKRPFVMNYIDGLFDILSTDWYILKHMTHLTLHVCCNNYGEDHVHWNETLSDDAYKYHCILESYDLTDKVNVLNAAIDAYMKDDEILYKDLAAYPDIEDIFERHTKMHNDQKWNNMLSALGQNSKEKKQIEYLGMYGIWNLSEYLLNHVDDQSKGLYVVFECEYERHKARVCHYTPTGYGVIPDIIENKKNKVEYRDEYFEEVLCDWSEEIPLNSNDFIIASNPNYNRVNKIYMERVSRPVEIVKVEKQVIKQVESVLRETVVVPAFYQTIMITDILEIIKNRYKIAINIFNHASYIKDKVLYIQIGSTTFNEVGRNQNHVIFEIDGNVIKDKEGIVNIIDEDNNTIYTQKYKIV